VTFSDQCHGSRRTRGITRREDWEDEVRSAKRRELWSISGPNVTVLSRSGSSRTTASGYITLPSSSYLMAWDRPSARGRDCKNAELYRRFVAVQLPTVAEPRDFFASCADHLELLIRTGRYRHS